jgi:AmiR/NasT family two-component response regulator
MRVWLVDEQRGDAGPPLEPLLRQLAERQGERLMLLGCGPVRPGLATELRGWQLDVVVVHEACWPDGAEADALLALDLGVLVVAAEERVDRFLPLVECHPIGLVSPPARAVDLWPALLATLAARRRHLNGKAALAQLQQRLTDRIVIERAKGILVQRLEITEDEAYKRLRVISRQQRRPMRDIAQSLLDAESLLLPAVNGFVDAADLEAPNPAE